MVFYQEPYHVGYVNLLLTPTFTEYEKNTGF